MVDIITKIKFKIAAGICNLKGKKKQRKKKTNKNQKRKKEHEMRYNYQATTLGKKKGSFYY